MKRLFWMLLACAGCQAAEQNPSTPSPMAGTFAPGGSGGVAGTLPTGGGGAGGELLPTAGTGSISPMAGSGGVGGTGAGGVGGAGGGIPDVPGERGIWASFGGDLAHTRSSPNETMIAPGNASELKIAFNIAAPGVTATPVLYKGVIYWTDWGGFVHATNLETQAELWKVDKSANGGGYTGSPAVTATHVYVANRNGLLSALDRETGGVAWEIMLDAGVHTHIWSSPVVAEEDHVLVIGIGGLGTRDNGRALPSSQLRTFRGSVVGVDSLTGELLWDFGVTDEPNGAGVSVWSSAAIDTTRKLAFIGTGNNYYEPVSDYSDSLLALNYVTGAYAWHAQFTEGDAWTVGTVLSGGVDGDVGATPNLFEINGRAVVGVGDKPGRYFVLDRETGVEVWSEQLTNGSGFQGGVMAPAAYHDGVIYVVSNNGTSSSTAFALAAETGATLWEFDLIDPTFGGPAIGNGVLYVGDQAGNVWALDAMSGKSLWNEQLPQGRGGGFSLVDGMLFTGYGFHFSESRAEPLTGGLIAFSRSGTIMPIDPVKTDDCIVGTPLTAEPTFSNVYQGVLCPAGCTKVCHSSSMEAGLRLDKIDIAYTSLVNVGAKGLGCNTGGHVLVVPNNTASSVLHSKLAAMPTCGTSMPPGVTPENTTITPAMMQAVSAWITAGAPNN